MGIMYSRCYILTWRQKNTKFCRGRGREAGGFPDELGACRTELYPASRWKSWLCNHRLGVAQRKVIISRVRVESLAHQDLTPGTPQISQQNNTCKNVKIKPSSVKMVWLVSGWGNVRRRHISHFTLDLAPQYAKNRKEEAMRPCGCKESCFETSWIRME